MASSPMPQSPSDPNISTGEVEKLEAPAVAETSSNSSSLSKDGGSTSTQNASSDGTSATAVPATSGPHSVKPELGARGGFRLTIDSLMQDEDEYTRYLRKLAAAEFPSLQVVVDFLGGPSNDTNILFEQYGASLLGCYRGKEPEKLWSTARDRISVAPMPFLLQNMIHASNQPEGCRPERLVLIVEGLKAQGLKILGTFLDIDPRVFERLLNFKREFTNEIDDVHVLDYVQGYFYRDSHGRRVTHRFDDNMLATASLNGKVRRWWSDIVGHEQRVVVVHIPEKELVTLPVDIIFLYPIPILEQREFRSPRALGSNLLFRLEPISTAKGVVLFHEYWNRPHYIGPQNETINNLNAMETEVTVALSDTTIPLESRSLRGAVTFVASKWSSLANRVQEAISETDAPDDADLALIRFMTRRRHLFSEARRTLTTLQESLGPANLGGPTAASLAAVGNKIGNWVAELDAVLSNASSALSLQEVERAMAQSARTIQLTVLAFVFIPLSAVSSGFGMNVDVLQDNPPVWWFVVVSAAVAVATLVYALLFRAINTALISAALFLAAVGLDIGVVIAKVFLITFWVGAYTLCLPLACLYMLAWLIVLFILVIACFWSPRRARELIWEEVFIGLPHWFEVLGRLATWFPTAYWNKTVESMSAFPSLSVNRFWRRGRKVPKPGIINRKSKEPDSASCIVM